MRIKRFKELLEDVGEKYAEKKFNIPPKFTEFDKQYRRKYNDAGQEVIYRDKDGVTILKNPGSLESVGSCVRGIIDDKGNFFVEQESVRIHVGLLGILNNLGIMKYNDSEWYKENPDNPDRRFITVQRKGDDDMFLGESNIWYREHYDIAREIYQVYLDKAKLKNPDITFVNKMINYQ